MSSSVGSSSTTPPSSHQKFQVDYDLIVDNLGDLNIIAGEGECRVTRVSSQDGSGRQAARLEVARPLPLILYANGMFLCDGPFRGYEEPTARQFVQDLMDGYFPSELQRRYPDGVPFKLTDKRDVKYKPGKYGQFAARLSTAGSLISDRRTFPGSGQVLDVNHSPAKLWANTGTGITGEVGTSAGSPPQGRGVLSPTPSVPPAIQSPPVAGARVNGYAAVAGSTGNLSIKHERQRQRFLQKLPEKVVKSGKVVNIRSAIAQRIHGSSNDSGSHSKSHTAAARGVTVIETDVVKDILAANDSGAGGLSPDVTAQRARHQLRTASRGSLVGGGGSRPGSGGSRPGSGGGSLRRRQQLARYNEVTTLRVKSETGEQTFIVKLRYSDTISDLKGYLNMHRPKSSPDFDVMSTFPNKVYSSAEATLEECGLIPNATVYMRLQRREGVT